MLCYCRHWTADEARRLRVCINGFLELVVLVLQTIHEFGPPVSWFQLHRIIDCLLRHLHYIVHTAGILWKLYILLSLLFGTLFFSVCCNHVAKLSKEPTPQSEYSGRFKGGGRPPPILTGCILKEAIILHENAIFLHKNFKNDPPPTLPPPIPNFCIHRYREYIKLSAVWIWIWLEMSPQFST